MKRNLALGVSLLLPVALNSQPSASKAAERAVALPLFASRAPLELVLSADFRLLSRDRDTLSTKRYPGTLKYVPAEGGDTIVVPVELRTRGHFRLLARNCPFVPLRVDFPRAKGPDAVAKTPFAGQSGLKLVTHCRNEDRYEQIVYREEMVYRVHNLVSPVSHRSRLAVMHYRDTTGKSLGKYPAFFIEHENDVARRNGGKIAELRGALYDDLDPLASVRFAMFAYMIGHVDLSIYALHNVRLIVSEGKAYTPLLYDFDFTGLVNAHYATPDPRLGIRDVRTRLYRGGCSQVEHVPQVANEFLALKAPVLALYDSAATYMDRNAVRDSKHFLNEFFETIGNPRELKASIIDRCVRNPGV